MVKQYVYNSKRYFTRYTLVGYFMILVAIYCAFTFFQRMNTSPYAALYLFFGAAAVYGTLNTFVFGANPKEVIFSDESITFISPWHKHSYRIDELQYFHVKEMPSNYQAFVRVGTKNGTKRRYWISYDHMENGKDIIAECLYIERKLNPSHIKFRGWEKGLRRPGQEMLPEVEQLETTQPEEN